MLFCFINAPEEHYGRRGRKRALLLKIGRREQLITELQIAAKMTLFNIISIRALNSRNLSSALPNVFLYLE